MQPDDVPPVDPAPSAPDPAPDADPASAPPTDASPPPVNDPNCDANGEVISDIQCRHCGYALRGLNIDGRCPECGTSVGWSIRGNLLQYSDPGWVERLATGTRWLIVAALIGIITGAGSGALGGDDAHPVQIVIELTVSLIGLIGIWLITSPEPGILETSQETARRITRYTTVTSFCLQFVGLAMMVVYVEALWYGVALLDAVVSLISFFALCIFARAIARRIPNPSLVKQTTIVMWGFAVSYGFVVLALIVGLIGGFEAAMVLGCVVLILLLIFVIWGLVLLFLYRAALVKAAQQARATWAAAQG